MLTFLAVVTVAERDDAALVAAWRGGDRAAGEALLERHYDAIVRFFTHKAGDQADDLTQRTFLACAGGLHGFRAESSFRAFLFGIARNVLFEHIRHRVRAGQRDPDFTVQSLADLAPGVATLASRRAEQRALVRALQQIPLEAQVLVELYYWEELGLDELATVLGIPEGTVKSRLHRARAQLREAMEKLDGTPEELESASQVLAQWAAGVQGRATPRGDR